MDRSFFTKQCIIAQAVIDRCNDSGDSDSDRETKTEVNFQEVLNNLAKHILAGWQDKVNAAANRGAFQTVLYSYDSSEIFQDNIISYLINGPEDYLGTDYWDEKGYISVKQMITDKIEYFDSSKVSYWSLRELNIITIRWFNSRDR
jgi:hypothetical protein